MSPKFVPGLSVAALLAFGVACDVSKSSNPLSPAVAGPIPGVNITAPKPMQPSAGTKIAVDQQPITLTVGNATTNGVRPLNYLFEVAADTNFTNKVFSRNGITPGDGQTSVRLPDALATGRTYYWRALAKDGANTGPYTSAVNFAVFTPIVINAPDPVAPTKNVTTDSVRPKFTVNNATHSGPVGAITYVIELANDSSFTDRVAVWTVGEQTTQTSFVPTQDLPTGKQFFWHARATDPTTTGPWSAPQVFQTPASAPIVGPAPLPVPAGGVADQLNLSQAAVYNSPPDIASWPATTAIQRIDMSYPAGLSLAFSAQNTWPDYVPPGWSGGLQYTVWAVVNIGGRWYTSGFIQMWRGRPSTGAPILTDFAANWAYDPARWGPMAGYQPHAGEQMGFFVSAGNARGEKTVTSVRERSNVVLVALPAGDTGSFAFSTAARIMFRR